MTTSNSDHKTYITHTHTHTHIHTHTPHSLSLFLSHAHTYTHTHTHIIQVRNKLEGTEFASSSMFETDRSEDQQF